MEQKILTMYFFTLMRYYLYKFWIKYLFELIRIERDRTSGILLMSFLYSYYRTFVNFTLRKYETLYIYIQLCNILRENDLCHNILFNIIFLNISIIFL